MSSEMVLYDIRYALSSLACGVVLAESNGQDDLQKYSHSAVSELKTPETLTVTSYDILGTSICVGH